MDKWQKKEIDFLKKNYSKLSSEEIARKFARSIEQVYQKAWEHNLRKSREYNSKIYSQNAQKKSATWTDEQIKILTTNFMELSFKELAVLIGKSWQSCQKKAKKIGLSKYMKEF